jgi:hypothetical protein
LIKKAMIFDNILQCFVGWALGCPKHRAENNVDFLGGQLRSTEIYFTCQFFDPGHHIFESRLENQNPF